jgi:uncharacterized membrane protein
MARAIGIADGKNGSTSLSGIRDAIATTYGRLGGSGRSIEPDPDTVLRLFGLREIGTGIGIFARPGDSRWLWGRVAGDLLDLAFLAFESSRGEPRRLAAAATAVAGVTAVDLYSALRLAEPHRPSRTLQKDGSIRIVDSVAVNRSPSDCYRAWRDLTNLPRIMSHIEEVRRTGERTSHWRVKGPAGTDVEWDAEITSDDPDQLIVWRSVAGSEMENDGSVRFQPGPRGRGTSLRVSLRYRPPAGTLGAFAAALFGEEPEQQIREDLRRFKQFLETGEVITTDGQPVGPPRWSGWTLGRSTRSVESDRPSS